LDKLISSARLITGGNLTPVALVSLAACGMLLGVFGAAMEAFPFQLHRGSGLSPMAASVFQSKLMELSATGPTKSGSLSPVVITDDEVNSYIKYDRPTFLPRGVRDLDIHFKPDGIHGAANVNFDELKPSQQSGSMLGAGLLATIFRGNQHLSALGVLETEGGTGTLTIKDVQIGSTKLSDWLVNWLIQTYVESEYKIDLSKPFLLPNHVTHIEFAPGKAIFVRGVTQKK
jgi:hypothetical protein